MVIDHKQTNASKNPIFNSYIDSYVPLYLEGEQDPPIRPEIIEDTLDDGFITSFDLTEEQLEEDMAMCRFLEGAK